MFDGMVSALSNGTVNTMSNIMVDKIVSALSGAMGNIFEGIMDFFYLQFIKIISFLFENISLSSISLFESDYIINFISFFKQFGWLLFVVSLVVAVFEFVLEYQNGRGQFKDIFMNFIKGFMAVNLFAELPPKLLEFTINIQSVLIKGLIDYKVLEVFDKQDDGSFSLQIPGMSLIIMLIILIAVIISIGSVFFANIKRGGILLIMICVGSLYMFSIPRGYTDNFEAWVKQVIALCVTAFLQTSLLLLGLLLLRESGIAVFGGLGLMLAAKEVPRVAQQYGLDTTAKSNLSSTIHGVSSGIQVGSQVKNIIKTA